MTLRSLFGAVYGLSVAAVDSAAAARKIGVVVMELEVGAACGTAALTAAGRGVAEADASAAILRVCARADRCAGPSPRLPSPTACRTMSLNGVAAC